MRYSGTWQDLHWLLLCVNEFGYFVDSTVMLRYCYLVLVFASAAVHFTE